MRKTILLLIALTGLLFAVPSNAQIKFGLRLGTNISNTDFDDMREINELRDVVVTNNAGFFVGPMMDIKLPILGFGADVGLHYSYKSYDIDNNVANEHVKSKQHMFEIPVNIKYNFDLGSILGIYVAAGPSFGFNLNPGSFWKDLTKGIADRIDGTSYERKSTEISLNFGAGLTILSKVQLGFNYNLGLTDAAKGSARNFVDAAWDKNAVKSRIWQIHATYLF